MVVGSDKLASFDDLFGITSESDSEASFGKKAGAGKL